MYYRFKGWNNEIIFYKGLNMKEIDKMDFHFFHKNFGEKEVYVTFSKSNSIDTNTVFKNSILILVKRAYLPGK